MFASPVLPAATLLMELLVLLATSVNILQVMGMLFARIVILVMGPLLRARLSAHRPDVLLHVSTVVVVSGMLPPRTSVVSVLIGMEEAIVNTRVVAHSTARTMVFATTRITVLLPNVSVKKTTILSTTAR